LSQDEIDKINLPPSELTDYAFMDVEKAIQMLGERARPRIKMALEALKNDETVYLEDGEKVV